MASACGGSTPTITPTGSGSVTISPAAVSVDQEAEVEFSATVIGISNSTVTWSIREDSAGGSITLTALYTAPATAKGTFWKSFSPADLAGGYGINYMAMRQDGRVCLYSHLRTFSDLYLADGLK